MTLYPRNLAMIVRAQRQMVQDSSVLWCLRMTGLGLYFYLLLGVAAEVCCAIGVVDWLDQ